MVTPALIDLAYYLLMCSLFGLKLSYLLFAGLYLMLILILSCISPFLICFPLQHRPWRFSVALKSAPSKRLGDSQVSPVTLLKLLTALSVPSCL